MPDKRLSPVYYNKMKFAERHISGSKKLLDVGCGEGGYFHIYEKSGIDYFGIDPDASVAGESSRVKIASAEKIPFPNKSFDTVVCMDVVEHVHSPDDAVSEMCRVLKKKGKLVISVPSARYPWTYDPINALLRPFGRHLRMGMWAWGHKRLFKREDFLLLLRRHGFRIELVEENTHGFVTFFLGYLPYLGVYVIAPLMRSFGFEKKSKISVSGMPVERGTVFSIFNALNKTDRRFFQKSHGLTICVIAKKGLKKIIS